MLLEQQRKQGQRGERDWTFVPRNLRQLSQPVVTAKLHQKNELSAPLAAEDVLFL